MSKKSENILAKAFIEDEPELVEESIPQEEEPKEKPKKKSTTRKKAPSPQEDHSSETTSDSSLRSKSSETTSDSSLRSKSSETTSDSSLRSKSSENLFLSLYSQYNNHLLTAAFHWCSATNTHFDSTQILTAFESYTKQNHEVPFTSIYTSLVPTTSFSLSILPDYLEDYAQLSPEQMIAQVYQSHLSQLTNEPPADWSKEEAANFKQVVRMLGYYPFHSEDPQDQRNLCRDLLNLLSDPDAASDYIKIQSALRIVLSFLHLKQLDAKMQALESEGASTKELKDLSDLKNKELSSITAFSRDSGFAERYAQTKARGANSFAGILAQMNEEKFENAMSNLYDIKTSAAIRQVADISTSAIMEQLAMTDSQYQDIVAKQLDELTKLRRLSQDQEEEIRRLRRVIKENDMIEAAIRSGIDLEEIV